MTGKKKIQLPEKPKQTDHAFSPAAMENDAPVNGMEGQIVETAQSQEKSMKNAIQVSCSKELKYRKKYIISQARELNR